MNIQGNINQLLTTAGIAARLSPLQNMAEARAEGKDISGKAAAAQSGLTDISKNLSNPQKSYTKTELSDIERRVAEHNRNIYTAKTAAIPGQRLSKYTDVSKLQPQAAYSATLKNIEADISKRREALNRMTNQGNARVSQNEEFGSIRDQILHPERYMEGGK